MTAPREKLSAVALSLDDIEKFPNAIRRKITEDDAPQLPARKWFMLGAQSVSDVKLVTRIVRILGDLRAAKRQKISEETIEKLVDIYLEGEERAPSDIDLERDNAALRARYLKITPTYSASDIRSFQTGDPPKNPSDPAARWKREGRLFAVPHGNLDLFPAFQFRDGAPHPGIKKILKALPADMTPWQIAFWFASGNGWLGGETPQSSLGATDEIVNAAGRLGEAVIG